MKLTRYFLPVLLIFTTLVGLLAMPSVHACFTPSFLKFIPKKSNFSAFLPSLASINTLTMYNFSSDFPENNPEITTIQKLALNVHDDYKNIHDGTCLTINALDGQKSYCSVSKGVYTADENPYITIYSRGFARESRPYNATENNDAYYKKILNALIPNFQVRGLPQKGGGVLSAYITLRENFIHTPCVSFDYPDARQSANFAQTVDLQCLDIVIRGASKEKKIILMGTSKGATTALKHELLNKTDIHPAGLILESPFLCLKDTILRLIKTAIFNLPFPSYLAFSAFNWFYPHYNPQEDNLEKLLININKDIPIFIVHLNNDSYVSNESMFCIVKTMAAKNKNIHLLVLHDPTKKTKHGKLTVIKPFQQAVNAFYKKYDLPCNEELAQEGETVLADAKKNAEAHSIQDWILTDCPARADKNRELNFRGK